MFVISVKMHENHEETKPAIHVAPPPPDETFLSRACILQLYVGKNMSINNGVLVNVCSLSMGFIFTSYLRQCPCYVSLSLQK